MRAIAIVVALCGLAAADELTWHAPAGCPSEIGARVEQRLGGSLDGLVDEIAVEVTREHGQFVAHVTIASDQRTLTAPRCDDLADAVAVIVARVASERRAAQPPVVTPIVVEPVAAPIAIVKPEIPPPAVATPPVWGTGLRLTGLSGIGGVPEVGLGGELAGHVRYERGFAELGYAAWVPSGHTIMVGSPARVDVDLRVFALRGGWAPARLPIRAWVTAEAGMMNGTGVDLADPRIESQRWIAFGAGFGVAWPMTPMVRIIGSVEVVAPIERARIVLTDGQEVYRSWPVSSRAAFGLEVGWR